MRARAATVISTAAALTDLTLIAPDGTPSHIATYGVTEGFFEGFALPMTVGGFRHDDFTPFQPPPPGTMALDFQLASDVVGGTIRRQELGMTLMLVFGGIAVVLAAVGIYGVVSYAGSLRRDEMATRLALGASPNSVFLLVITAITFLATTIPARRAARLNPASALQSE